MRTTTRAALVSRALLAALTSFLLLPLTAGPAPAAGSAECDFAYDPELQPGLTMNPASGKVTSHGETGEVECEGTINGHEVTGPGTFGFEGTFGTKDKASCTSGGSGDGHVLMTVPTKGGPQKLKDSISYAFGPAAGDPPLVGGWRGTRTTGRFVVVPTKGDCITSPVEQLRGQGHFVVSGY
jgi:hypothetical protein